MNNFFLWPQPSPWAITATLGSADRLGPTVPSEPVVMAILTVCMAMVIVFVIGALRRELGAATLVGLFLGGVLFALGTVTP